MKSVLTVACMFLIAMSSYAQSGQCQKCEFLENDHQKIVKLPKNFSGDVDVTISIADELAKGAPDLYRENGIDIMWAQNRFFTVNDSGGFLTVIGGVDVKQEMNFSFNVNTSHGDRMVMSLSINGSKLPNGQMLPVPAKDCYMDATIVDHSYRLVGKKELDGLCRIKTIFIFDRSCDQ